MNCIGLKIGSTTFNTYMYWKILPIHSICALNQSCINNLAFNYGSHPRLAPILESIQYNVENTARPHSNYMNTDVNFAVTKAWKTPEDTYIKDRHHHQAS